MANHTLSPEAMHALVADIEAAATDAEKIVLIVQWLHSATDDIYANNTEP